MTKELAAGFALILVFDVHYFPVAWMRSLYTGNVSQARASQHGSPGQIIRLDPALDAIVPSETAIEMVHAGDDGITEGPVWTRDGALLFSHMAANVIYKLTPNGQTSIFREQAGFVGAAPRNSNDGPNGLTFDKQGRLLICERGNRRVTRLEPDGRMTVVADRYQGTPFTRPNDVIVKSDGSIYFTDMCLGCTPELGFQGVFRIVNDRIDVVAKMPAPNGLAFSPDEKYLYVSSSDMARQVWMRFAVRRDGSLDAGRVFFDATNQPGAGVPDGMKVDAVGNLYATGPGGVWIISPEARALGRIELPASAQNVAWGDDGRSLYITASSIYRVRLRTTGKRPCCDSVSGAPAGR